MSRDITIAHTSDVHVDDGYTARLFGGDGAGSLRAVLEAACKAGADALLLAGDTFESHRLPGSLMEHTARVFAAYDIPVVILPGNHDPAVETAVFFHPALSALDNLHVLGVTHEDHVKLPHLDLEIFGRAHRHYGDMDPFGGDAHASRTARTTAWRVAVGHGHYTPAPDRSTKLRPSWLIGDAELHALDADYVALGHWNRRAQVGPAPLQAWYSGSPETAGSINLVRLSQSAGVSVEALALDLPLVDPHV